MKPGASKMSLISLDIPDDVKQAVIDYFTPEQLCEYLGLTTEDLVEAFPDEVEEQLDALLFLMEYQGCPSTHK